MPIPCNDYLELTRRPRWDKDGGEWYVEQTPPRNGVSKMYRHKPSINALCEPLMGTALRDKNGRSLGVRYPTLERRHQIYRECIESLIVFKDHIDNRFDLFTLAVYRRQVTQRGGIAMDRIFFDIALSMVPALSWDEWRQIAQRMPDRAPIKKACLEQSRLQLK